MMNRRELLLSLCASSSPWVLGFPKIAHAGEAIEIGPHFGNEKIGKVKVGGEAIPVAGHDGVGQDLSGWFLSDDVTLPLHRQDIDQGVLSFWIMPLAQPVTGVVRARKHHDFTGWDTSWPDSHDLVLGGDLSKPAISLRITLHSDGSIRANHLSWSRGSKWLAGVASQPGAVAAGQWAQIAYGVGSHGQRLWINGKLVGHNPKGTSSISWPYEIRFQRLAAWLRDINLQRGTQAITTADPHHIDTVVTVEKTDAPAAKQLLNLIKDGADRQRRLDTLVSRLGPLPYEQAKLNIINRSTPWLLFQLLRFQAGTVFPANKRLPRGEAAWAIGAARDWDKQLAGLSSGTVMPLKTTTIRPDVTSIHLRDNSFWQDGHPIYLVGSQDPNYGLYSGLGFAFSGHEFGPGWTFRHEQAVRFLPGSTDTRNRTAAAKKHGWLFDFLYTSMDIPGWAFKKWPIKRVGLGFIHYDITDPRAWKLNEAALRTNLAPLKGAANLLSIDLSNEPAYNGVTYHVQQRWVAWLQKRFGSLGALNAAWGEKYRSWSQIEVPDFVNRHWSSVGGQKFPTDDKTLKVYGDWSRFNVERVTYWFSNINAIVKEYVPQAFTYIKMLSEPASNARGGIDVVANVRLTDLSGSDSWWVYEGSDADDEKRDKRYSVGWQESLMNYDLITSANRKAPASNGEFHLFHGGYKPMGPHRPHAPPGHWDQFIPANHFYAGIWQQALHGQAMGDLWTHWPRNNIAQHAGGLDAISRATMDLNRLGREVQAINSQPRKVGILWGLTPIFWDKSGEAKTRVAKQWRALWEAITLNGLRPRFIFERDLMAGKQPDVDVVIAVGFNHIETDALRELRIAARHGLEIWSLDGKNSFAYDPYNRPYASQLRPAIARALDGRALSKEPVRWMRTLLSQAKLLPPIDVQELNPAAYPRVCWETASLDQRRLINMCNYGRQSVHVKITNQQGRVRDLISQAYLPASSIPLEVEQVRLIELS